jgi:glycosyltransferase involved in cell wall biosynthesis
MVPAVSAAGRQVTARFVPDIVHVSPTYFAPESLIGGGERYAEELSAAMSQVARVRFVSFGPRGLRERLSESFERVVLRSWTRAKLTPFAPLLARELRGAQTVHCFQLNTLPTFLCALWCRLRGVPVFVTDFGGGGWTPGYQVDVGPWIAGHLPISAYAARMIPARHRNAGIIYGGVNLQRFAARGELSHDGRIAFLGRILPHKGIHHLVEGLPPGIPLDVIGPPVNAAYVAELQRLAQGKDVRFLHGLSDAEIARRLQRAAVLVHPTPTDARGNAGVNELLGLAVLEAMASNCPVVVSDAASLPELVEDGVSGLVVPPNDPAAIRQAIEALVADAQAWRRLAAAGRERVLRFFTWPAVVERCRRAYAAAR